MTGHLDGTGLRGNLHKMNEQIRNFCYNNNKILLNFLFWIQTTFVKADIAAPIIMPYLLKKDNELL